MRARPATCPSMRRSRVDTDFLAARCILIPYPHMVYWSSYMGETGPTVMSANQPAMQDHHGTHASHRRSGAEPGPKGNFTTDPICGMRVDAAKSPHRFEHAGR